jgi:hypothetical protein
LDDLSEGGGEEIFESRCSLLMEWKIFLSWDRLGFHHGFDHVEGRFVGVFLRRGEVIRPSEMSNHVSRSGVRVGNWILHSSLRAAVQLHLLQSGQGLEELLGAVRSVVQIAVWSEPVDGRLLDHKWMSEEAWLLAKVRSITLGLVWEL